MTTEWIKSSQSDTELTLSLWLDLTWLYHLFDTELTVELTALPLDHYIGLQQFIFQSEIVKSAFMRFLFKETDTAIMCKVCFMQKSKCSSVWRATRYQKRLNCGASSSFNQRYPLCSHNNRTVYIVNWTEIGLQCQHTIKRTEQLTVSPQWNKQAWFAFASKIWKVCNKWWYSLR